MMTEGDDSGREMRFGRPYGAPYVVVFAFPGRRPPRRTPAWAIFGAFLRDARPGKMRTVRETTRAVLFSLVVS